MNKPLTKKDLERRARTMRTLERLIKLADDPSTKRKAMKIRNRMQVPMRDILAKVPGDNVRQKSALLKATRQSWYGWMREEHRPAGDRAVHLAKLTGYSVAEIRGF